MHWGSFKMYLSYKQPTWHFQGLFSLCWAIASRREIPSKPYVASNRSLTKRVELWANRLARQHLINLSILAPFPSSLVILTAVRSFGSKSPWQQCCTGQCKSFHIWFQRFKMILSAFAYCSGCTYLNSQSFEMNIRRAGWMGSLLGPCHYINRVGGIGEKERRFHLKLSKQVIKQVSALSS